VKFLFYLGIVLVLVGIPMAVVLPNGFPGLAIILAGVAIASSAYERIQLLSRLPPDDERG